MKTFMRFVLLVSLVVLTAGEAVSDQDEVNCCIKGCSS